MNEWMKWVSSYVEQVLALWAQGFLGHIGFAKESNWGTAVAATDYIEAMSEGLSETIERFEVKNIVGGFHEPDDVAGVHRVNGNLVSMGHPLPLGLLLKAAMNTVSGSTVLSGFLYTTKFITTKSEFAAGVPSQPYTLEIFRDVTSSHQYAGCVLNTLQLALAPNQDLRITADWIGKSMAHIAKTTPTFPGSPLNPFTFDTASIQLAGAATARIEALTITVDNQLEGVVQLNNTKVINKITRRGPQMVKISGTLDFVDITEALDFKNQTERALKVSLTKANSFQFVVDVPRFNYTAVPLGNSGRERLTLNFEGTARYLTSSGLAIDMALTTTKSNW